MSSSVAPSAQAQTYDVLVFSPHLDDAVYSLGGTMLAERRERRRVLVVTVFGHGHDVAPPGTGPYDDYAAREAEDRAAMAALDVDYLWLNLPELLFRRVGLGDRLAQLVPHATFTGTAAFTDTQRAMLAAVARHADDGTRIYLPLAVGAHPDHRLVYEAGRSGLPGRDVRFYEDVPYALDPALVEARMAVLAGTPAPSAFRVARALARLVFRGGARIFALLPLYLFLAAAELARRASRHAERISTVSVETRDVGASLRAKADAMRLYRSQTPLFFEASVEEALSRREGAPVERAWRLA